MIKPSLQSIFFLIGAFACFQAGAQQSPAVSGDEEVEPGYLIVTGWYKDTAVSKAYVEKVAPVIRKYGFVTAKIGMPGKNLNVLEGSWVPRGFSFMQFSSEKAVKQFWTSTDYQMNVKPIREGQSALDVLKVGAAFGTKPTMDAHSALLVFLVDISDREKLMDQYVPKAPKIVARYGGKFLVSSAQWATELLEGDHPSESIVVVEFPSADALRAFWNDEEYKVLSEIRKSTGKWSVIEILPFTL
ncbi:MAG: DUF1330 domain-containing protein [Congregibacter sp.]